LVDASGETDASGDGGSAYVAAVVADRPVLYLRLGERVTDSPRGARDSSGSRHDAGAFQGPVICGVVGAIKGDNDTACHFDGAGSAITVAPYGLKFAAAAPYSVEAWVRPATLTTGGNSVFSVAGRLTLDDGYMLFVDAAARRGVTTRETADGGRSTPAGGDLSSTYYSHLVTTFDGALLTIYVDGDRKGQAVTSTPFAAASTIPFSIGANGNADDHFFVGDLDEVAVYDHALSAERVRAHHDVGLGIVVP